MEQALTKETEGVVRSWQARVFGVLWIGYASYYLCRMNFAAAQPAMLAEFTTWTKAQIGLIPTVYSVFYAVGQFVNGQLGSRYGARKMLGVGLALIAAANLIFPATSSYPLMLALWAANGFAQATGWPAIVQTMSNWFRVGSRGTVMGFISTCYQVGNVLAWLLAGFLVDAYGWRSAFWLPGLLLLPVVLVVVIGLRDSPEQAGMPHIRDDEGASPAGATAADNGEWTLWRILRVTLSNVTLWKLASAYFLFNAVRYGFMNWSIQYFADFHGQEIKNSALRAIAFPLIGALGAISAGWVSDHWFRSRRAPVCAIMLACLALLCFAFVSVPAGDTALATLVLAGAGFMIYGPDATLTGAAAIDVAHPKAAASATGFVMAMGNLGAALISGVGIGWLLDRSGGNWSSVFTALAVLSLASAAAASLLWNARPKGAPKH